MSDTHTPGANPNLPSAGGPSDPFGDEAMRLFTAMQQRIEAIKAREAASAQREAEVAARLTAIDTRTAELASLEARIAARDAEAVKRQAELDRVQGEIMVRQERAREIEAALGARQESIAAEISRLADSSRARDAELQDRERRLVERNDEHRKVMAALERRSEELERVAAQLAARETRATETEASYQMAREAAMREIEESRAASAKLAGDLQARAIMLAQVKAEIDSRQTQVQSQWSEVEGRIAQLARFKQELDARESVMATREAEARVAMNEADRRRTSADERESRAAEALDAARRLKEDAERSLAASTAELRSAQTELARMTAAAAQATRSAEELADQRTMLEVSAAESTERARVAETRIAEMETELTALRNRPPEIRVETRTERVVERVGPTDEEIAAMVRTAVSAAKAETSDQVAAIWAERLRLAQDATADAEQRAQRMEATAADTGSRLAAANDEIRRVTETFEQRGSQMAAKLFDAESRLAEVISAQEETSANADAQVRQLQSQLAAQAQDAQAAESRRQSEIDQLNARVSQIASRAIEAEGRAETLAAELGRASAAHAAESTTLREQVAAGESAARDAVRALEELRTQPPRVKIEPDPATLHRVKELEAELSIARQDADAARADTERVRSVSEKLGLEARRIKLEAAEVAERQASELASLRSELAARPPARLLQEAEELRLSLHAAREQIAASVRERGELETRSEVLTQSVRQSAEADRAAMTAQIAALQGELSARTGEHAAALAEINDKTARIEAERLNLAARLAETEVQLSEASSESRASITAMRSTIDELQARLTDAEAQARVNGAAAHDARREIAALTERLSMPVVDEALTRERDALARRIAELEDERARERSAMASSLASLQERLEAAETRAVAASGSETQARREIVELQTSLSALADAKASSDRFADESQAEAQARIAAEAERQAQVLALQDRIATLESMLERETARGQAEQAHAPTDTGDVVHRLKEALQQRESSLRNLSGRLSQLEHELRDRDDRLATLGAGPMPVGGSSTADMRRHRLARYRAALRERTSKIETAYNAIRQKEAMLDRVVEQRVNSALAAAALVPKPATEPVAVGVIAPPTSPIPISEAPRSSNTFALTAAAAAVVAVTLTPLCYLMIKPFMGFTYAATAVIKADTGGTVPTQSEMALWNSRHTKLLSSPQIYDQTAKKFGQQRVDHLAGVDQVQSYFGSRLTVGGAVQGELTLRLRGNSPSEAENALRTYVETVVSTANATRILQGNEYSTIVDEKPQADPDPLTGSEKVTWALAAVIGLFSGGIFWFACHRFRESAKASKSVEVNPALPVGFLREPAAGGKPGWTAPGAVAASVAGLKELGRHLTKGGPGGKKAA